MKTTLNEIRAKIPCSSGWSKLLTSLNKTKADDDEITFKYILESNGIEDAVWCLKVKDYKEVCLFCADVAELVLPIFEKKHPDDKRPREAIEGVRLYHSGDITIDALRNLRTAAAYAADAAADADAAYAADAAADADAAYAAADAAAAADADAAYAAADAAAAADADAAYAAADAAADAARKEQWNKIEALFIKYFC